MKEGGHSFRLCYPLQPTGMESGHGKIMTASLGPGKNMKPAAAPDEWPPGKC